MVGGRSTHGLVLYLVVVEDAGGGGAGRSEQAEDQGVVAGFA